MVPGGPPGPLGADGAPKPRNYRQTVCTYWLRGLCMKGDTCGFLHQFDPERMPVCRSLLKFGQCKEPGARRGGAGGQGAGRGGWPSRRQALSSVRCCTAPPMLINHLPCLALPAPRPADCPYKHTLDAIKECNMYKLGFCIYGPAVSRPGGQQGDGRQQGGPGEAVVVVRGSGAGAGAACPLLPSACRFVQQHCAAAAVQPARPTDTWHGIPPTTCSVASSTRDRRGRRPTRRRWKRASRGSTAT